MGKPAQDFKFQVKLAGQWVNYPDKADKTITQAYLQGKKEVTFQLKVGNRKNEYTLNFVKMSQSTKDSDKTRAVRAPYDIASRTAEPSSGDKGEKDQFAGDDVSDSEAVPKKKAPPPVVIPDDSGKKAVEAALEKEIKAISTHKRFDDIAASAKKEKCDAKIIKKAEDASHLVKALESALEGMDVDKLKDAAKKAEAFGLHGALLKQVSERQKEIAFAKARQAITAVMAETAVVKGKTEEELVAMKIKCMKTIKESSAAGLGEEEVRPPRDRVRKLHNAIQDLKGAIRVYCRTRPFNQREKDMGAKPVLFFADDKMHLTLRSEDGDEEKFGFDTTFNPGTQQEVYDELSELVQSAFDGYNITVFAYGQTGSGKTFTMYGPKDNLGCVCRAIRDVFVVAKEYEANYDVEISCGMVELYLALFTDLLAPKSAKPVELTVRKSPAGETFLEGQVRKVCKTSDELWGSIQSSFDSRRVAATAMNGESSRSHLIVSVWIKLTNRTTKQVINGKLVMVDLAGSERVKDSMVEGDQLKEAIEINKSLTVLGDVMEQLTTGSKSIGYRNHALTNILQDALGGTAKTLMFANVSPASVNFAETVMTCKWAQRAKNVTNTGGKEDPKAKAKSKAKAKPAARKK